VGFKAGSSRGSGKPAVAANKPAAAWTFSAPSECGRQLQPVSGPQWKTIKLPECDLSDIVRGRNFFGRIKQLRKTPPGCPKRSCRESPFTLQAD
jgi:hypothetical protein